jgi:lipopolysaccharide transport system permease protein
MALTPPPRETVYDSRSAFSQPLRLVRDAWIDLRSAPAIGIRLFQSTMTVRFRKSWLGYLWLLIPAAATALVCVYVQSRRIIPVPDSEQPFGVVVLIGVVLWQVFVESINAPLQQLTAYRQAMTRSTTPHEAFFFAGVLEVLLNVAVRLVAVGAVLVIFGVPIGASLLLIPLGILGLVGLGFFLGLMMAPLGLLYDDVGRGLTVATRFLFFLTPVVYAAPRDGLMRLNPVTPLLETTRGWFFGDPPSGGFVVMMVVAAVGPVIAGMIYRIARPHIFGRLG